MEGESRAASGDDAGYDRIEITQYVASGYSKRLEASPAQIAIANKVLLGLLASSVNFAVDLDGETRREAREIDTIAHLGILPAKFEAAWSHTQFLPEQNLGQQHFLSGGAG